MNQLDFYGGRVSKLSDIERRELEEEQKILVRIYAKIEANPERYGDDFQRKLDFLDDRMENNRCILEGRWR